MQNQRKPWKLINVLASALIALSLCSQANAFTWRDDPFSFPDTSNLTESRSGNSITYSNFLATNGSPFTLPELGVIVPWAFPILNGTAISMTWSNAQDGWVNTNVDGTTLLVTLDNVAGRLRFGDVAGDAAGTLPLDPTRTVLGVSETRALEDLIPFLDLGSFAPNESKAFELTFTYHFGDNRQLNGQAPDTAGALNTVSPVPEPATLLLVGIGLLGLRRNQSRK